MKPLIFLILIIAGIAIRHCNKSDLPDNESILYGTWVKGNSTGDTLPFVKKNGKNVILNNMSFNPGFNAPTESEYSYSNERLSIKGYLGPGINFLPVDSFGWKQVWPEFEIGGNILFPFIAATLVKFTHQEI